MGPGPSLASLEIGMNNKPLAIKHKSNIERFAGRRLSREEVLAYIKAMQCDQFTTKELAEKMAEKEYAVRAAVSWMVMGGILAEVGMVTRRTKDSNLPYRAKAYKWTGRLEVKRVPRSQQDREVEADCARFNGDWNALMSVFFKINGKG
jgi:hypothetical protein